MAAAGGGKISGEELLAMLLRERQERESANALIAEWMEQQKRLYTEQIAQHMQFMQDFFEVHSRTLQGLAGRDAASAAASPSADRSRPAGSQPVKTSQPPGDDGDVAGACASAPLPPEEPPRRHSGPPIAPIAAAHTGDDPTEAGAVPEAAPAPAAAAAEEGGAEGSADFEQLNKGEELMNWWRRTSGMQTVEKWVCNYKKHPAGWGAMLMIHGIPEVTGRLRSKVENYAIYSALFLSMSIALLTDPPDPMTSWADDVSKFDFYWNHVRMRIYLYSFAIGTAAHMLSILLAMAFVNALNEAARDSDVYRMFSRGQGFKATVKCQISFRIGCVADFVAVLAAVSHYIGWEAVGGCVLMVAVCLWVFRTTAGKLFRSVSIVRYWREELGGKPDKDDPYDLKAPIGFFQDLMAANRKYFAPGATGSTGDVSYATLVAGQGAERRGSHDHAGHGPVHAAAVAALF